MLHVGSHRLRKQSKLQLHSGKQFTLVAGLFYKGCSKVQRQPCPFIVLDAVQFSVLSHCEKFLRKSHPNQICGTNPHSCMNLMHLLCRRTVSDGDTTAESEGERASVRELTVSSAKWQPVSEESCKVLSTAMLSALG